MAYKLKHRTNNNNISIYQPTPIYLSASTIFTIFVILFLIIKNPFGLLSFTANIGNDAMQGIGAEQNNRESLSNAKTKLTNSKANVSVVNEKLLISDLLSSFYKIPDYLRRTEENLPYEVDTSHLRKDSISMLAKGVASFENNKTPFMYISQIPYLDSKADYEDVIKKILKRLNTDYSLDGSKGIVRYYPNDLFNIVEPNENLERSNFNMTGNYQPKYFNKYPALLRSTYLEKANMALKLKLGFDNTTGEYKNLDINEIINFYNLYIEPQQRYLSDYKYKKVADKENWHNFRNGFLQTFNALLKLGGYTLGGIDGYLTGTAVGGVINMLS